jgi:hypothetical protein
MPDLVETLRAESRSIFPERMRDGHAYHSTARALDKAADEIDRLNALLGEREAQLEEAREVLQAQPDYAADTTFAAIWQWLKRKDSLLTKLGEGGG